MKKVKYTEPSLGLLKVTASDKCTILFTKERLSLSTDIKRNSYTKKIRITSFPA